MGRLWVVLGVAGAFFFGQLSPASALAPSITWDDEGFASVSAGPLTFDMELVEFSSPKEIRKRQEVDVDIEVSSDASSLVCDTNLAAIPLFNGTPIAAGVQLTSSSDYESTTVSFPVSKKGTYAVRIEGSLIQSNSYCYSENYLVPFSTTIDLFTIDEDLPGPASKKKVQISSTGPHTLVANTYRKSSSIRITYYIKDKEKRKDLVHSMCMEDVYDCWFEDLPLKKSKSVKKTSTGWTKTWDFWWERSSPSQCSSYYWQQPDVSAILVVKNRDGVTVGRKKHRVKLTCRL